MARIFSFERELYATLDLVPLAVRRKLDLAGLKISLAGWQALPDVDRRALAGAAAFGLDDDASVAAFSETLRAAAARAGVALAHLPLPASPWPWRGPTVPPLLGAKLVEIHATLDDATWSSLSDEDRYVLLKLADAKREPERLRAALVELGPELGVALGVAPSPGVEPGGRPV
jgi:hypothetical protein